MGLLADRIIADPIFLAMLAKSGRRAWVARDALGVFGILALLSWRALACRRSSARA